MQAVQKGAEIVRGDHFAEFRITTCAAQFRQLLIRGYKNETLLSPGAVDSIGRGPRRNQRADENVAIENDAQSSSHAAREADSLADDRPEPRRTDARGNPLYPFDGFFEDLRAQRFLD